MNTTQENAELQAPEMAPKTAQVAPLDLRPLMFAYMACTMAMMAFVSLIGPIARVLGLPPWQAGTVVTVGGVLWILASQPWGRLSDRHGRRVVLLSGVGGFMLAYWAMSLLLIVALHVPMAVGLVFAGLLLTRGAIGAFFAAIPATGQALVADYIEPQRRAGAMASLGAANGVGMVLGPALAALLVRLGLDIPLYVTALLPLLAFAVLWKYLPRRRAQSATGAGTVRLGDRRLRWPMAVAFIAMFCVSIGQITVGFFAIDRLALAPDAAAKVAGFALTLVGVGLIGSQLLVRRLPWPPQRLIEAGAWISAIGFGAVAWVQTEWLLAGCFFVAALGMGWIFPAFSALAANAVQPNEQGAAAGAVGAAQGLGIVLGPLAGTLLYEWTPGMPYLLVGGLLIGIAVWARR